jgi:competence protein ComEC
MLAETAGTDAELGDIEQLPGVRCSRDLCFAEIVRDERRWRLMATRSPHLVAWKDLIRACASVDVVISDRRLPPACTPRWLKADRAFLKRSGGMAISFDSKPSVETVADRVGLHPWGDGYSR